MGLQRTPPQRVQHLSSNPAVAADEVLQSGASPFQPLNPAVMRSPPAGSQPHSQYQLAPSPTPQPPPPPKRPEGEPEAPQDSVEEVPAEEEMEQEQEDERATHKSLIVDDRPIRPAPAIMIEPEVSMEVDEPGIAPVPEPEAGPSMTSQEEPEQTGDVEMEELEPEPEIESQPKSTQTSESIKPPEVSTPPPSEVHPLAPAPKSPSLPPAPVTPATKTPRSRTRRQTNQLPAPPAPIQVDDTPQAVSQYGRRYQVTYDALERAVKAGTQRWTADNLKDCFPHLAEQMPRAMENAWMSTSHTMRTKIMSNAQELLKHYKAGPALQIIDEIAREAKEHAKLHGGNGNVYTRPDAWRPNLAPHALVAATNLPALDEAYERLRDEYLGLHKDCQERYASILAKQTQLKQLEESVGDGVVELDKTLKALDGLPVEDMMIWTEAAETKMETRTSEYGE
ncbi:hypothetical protein C365_05156 [Cryptococcus neoformans Bt85]|nr:hypothetical protein C365_05156 [Cryptococcus neoformans var. grubii Bt85]OXM77147.1 hypothetical protein C364_05212 [Cryptococcus neoformans var. grubii Bt63]